MKAFFSTLSAILVAAVIIWVVFAINQTHQADLKLRAELRQMNQDTEFSKAQREWDEQMTKDRNFDPLAQKLTARLTEIKDAIDNDKSIPPSPWQTPETPAANNEQSQQPAAPEIQSQATEYVILNRDVEVAHGARKVVISAGAKLPAVSRGSRIVGVRFAGEQQIIPESATSESK
jgi:hypothetical protein